MNKLYLEKEMEQIPEIKQFCDFIIDQATTLPEHELIKLYNDVIDLQDIIMLYLAFHLCRKSRFIKVIPNDILFEKLKTLYIKHKEYWNRIE